MWGVEKKGRMEGSNKEREAKAAKAQSGLPPTIFFAFVLVGPSLLLTHIKWCSAPSLKFF